MSDHTEQARKEIRIVVVLACLLTAIGLVFIYSASSVYALERFGSPQYFLKRQLAYCVASFVGFLIFALIPIKLIKRYASILFLACLGLTLLTILPALSLKVHGSSRWVTIFGKSFQPSEFLKFSLFIYMGSFIARKRKYVRSLLHGYIPFLLILGITFIVLLKQPDFGSVVTIMITSLLLFFIAEFRMMHLAVTVGLSLPLCVYLIVAKAYRLNRILIFLNPWSDPRGRGFQIIQSLIAIGSGQTWGLGIANSKQKFFYLPMQHTDFIFPILAEETGFVGSCILLAGYFLFFLYGLRVAFKLHDPFAFFTTLGFIIFISLQALINFMVTTGLVPTKGLGLPFVSFGGTSLLSVFCMIGLIVNFYRHEYAVH